LLRSPDCLGANVTVPHKEAVLPLLDFVDQEAALIGAVNTIVHRNGRLVGYNTDGVGFLQALDRVGFDPKGTGVLLLGAGGAARAVAFALARHGAAAIYIANRTVERARRLVKEVNEVALVATGLPLTEDALEAVWGAYDLVVNSTTVGMRHTEAEAASPLPRRFLSRRLLIYDLVYNPPETTLLQEALAAGARGVGGLGMLVYQGAAAFELWTGRPAPVEVMFTAAQEGLASQAS
jgi:shikimate dehydrogenase